MGIPKQRGSGSYFVMRYLPAFLERYGGDRRLSCYLLLGELGGAKGVFHNIVIPVVFFFQKLLKERAIGSFFGGQRGNYIEE